jgi:C1A family cysteine protease
VKRNRRILICIFAVFAAVLLLCLIIFFTGKAGKNTNSSRRDGGNGTEYDAEADLAGLSGDEIAEPPGSSPCNDSKPSHGIGSAIIEEDVNNPVTDEVDQVKKISIPEAVMMGAGDIGAFYSNPEFEDCVPVDISSFSAKDIPAKYDSRDVDGKRYVTGVKDQGYSSLCWIYACMGAVESDLLKHHDDMDSGDINLSEKHLAYYNLHRAEGSVNGEIDNDYRELVNAEDEPGAWVFDYDTGYLVSGGVTDYCISVLTAWKGPVEETGSNSIKTIYGASSLFSDNSEIPSDAYESSYHVQAVNQMPCEYSNNTLIKQMIMEHGSATIGVCADDRFYKNNKRTLYSDFEGEKVPTADHEVLIIGWDDDFSASGFKMTPKGDGAWLCRNSWGKGSGEEGYFWLSYYDETIAISNAASYKVAAPGDDDWYDNNYQAAGFLSDLVSIRDDTCNSMTAFSAASNPYGVLYEAGGSQTLEAVGLMSLDLYQQYELEVYINPEEEDGNIIFSKSDEPAVRTKISSISGGFHTFELDRKVDLEKGDKFFILIKPVTDGRLVFEQAQDDIGIANYDDWKNLTGNVHNNYEASGRSYYISDDAQMMVKQTDKDFFVKAYTNNR